MLVGPSFNTDSVSRKVTLNTRVPFDCEPDDAFPTNISYTWMKDDKILSNKKTFTIEEASYDDEGTYICIASHQYSNATKRFELKVKSKKLLSSHSLYCYLLQVRSHLCGQPLA